MRHSFKKYFRNVDKVLFLSVMLLIAIGLVLIASATHANIPGPHRYRFVFRQALFVIVNLILGGYLMRFDYRILKHVAKPLYIFNLVMLVAVMVVGKSALGAQRWLQLGPISIQPSEFSKAIMIVWMPLSMLWGMKVPSGGHAVPLMGILLHFLCSMWK